MHLRNFAIIFILACLAVISPATLSANQDNFALGWQFELALPSIGLAGNISGTLSHVRNRTFKFEGSLKNIKSPIKSGPLAIKSTMSIGTESIAFKNLSVGARSLGIQIPQLGLNRPDIRIEGSGEIYPAHEKAIFNDLTVHAGNLPPLKIKLDYSPAEKGSLNIYCGNPQSVIEAMASSYFKELEKWDKSSVLSLTLRIKHLNTTPVAQLVLAFKDMSASSPDGKFIMDSVEGKIETTFTSSYSGLNADLSFTSGEVLFDTFYIDLNEHPLLIHANSDVPVFAKKNSANLEAVWKGLGRLVMDTLFTVKDGSIIHTSNIRATSAELGKAFALFAVEPMSLGNVSAKGSFDVSAQAKGKPHKTTITGKAELRNAAIKTKSVNISGINSRLPFAISLNDKFLAHVDETLPLPKTGSIDIAEISAGPLELKKIKLPLTVSSNMVQFGKIPTLQVADGTLIFSDLKIRNPFSENFVIHSKIDARDINMLPFSPKSLPVNGSISGDMEIWLLKDHLSTNGKLYGQVYGGNMSITEIFAENIFDPSRQYGADIKVTNLDLEPLSKALDVGRITGRINLSLSNLVVAYNQPASFVLHVTSDPDSDEDRDISLKAVNTLSVIGTGSGLTGAGVGIFSQFFKEFSYAGLGLECTLNDDIFKIRGLIRDDGIEYIIKRPPLFGINVVNSNPHNLISFSDMLKRLKRVIKN